MRSVASIAEKGMEPFVLVLAKNEDGFGNQCAPDINNDGVVNVVDLGALRLAFFATPGDDHWNADADFNADGVVNVVDLGTLRQFFFGAPGPGLPN